MLVVSSALESVVPEQPSSMLPDLDSDAAIGKRLALIRVGLGMTQAGFAASLNVSPRSYQHYEKGTRSISAELLRQLRTSHGLAPNWVLLGQGLPREGQDAEALAAFVEELVAHLAATQVTLPPKNQGKIISGWWKALRDGTRVGMPDVRHWVDLLKE